MVIDGTLVPIDRVAADRPFYAGKRRIHGMNLQVIASPQREPVGCPVPCPVPPATRPGPNLGHRAPPGRRRVNHLADKGYIAVGEP